MTPAIRMEIEVPMGADEESQEGELEAIAVAVDKVEARVPAASYIPGTGRVVATDDR